MVERKRGSPDRIGTPDPENEPVPPRIDDAGALGEVGERKLEHEREKKGIWGERPPTPDENPRDPAARKPAAPPERAGLEESAGADAGRARGEDDDR